jgi:histidinol-phosphate aminotransferase
MYISRRTLLNRLAAGAIAGVACNTVSELAAFADAFPLSEANLPAKPILLSRNENAYGPSPKVLAAVREALLTCNRYPRTECELLSSKVAGLHHVRPEQVILGCGASEIMCMAAMTVLGPGKKLVQASPTYPVLGEFARSIDAEVINVPLNRMYEHDLDAMLARCDASTGLVYICNPNNPTGTLTPRKDIEAFIRKLPASTFVMIDEAYHDFVAGTSGYTSFLDDPIDDTRVMAARTFSKIHGLAGMRIGYLVTPANLPPRLSTAPLRLGVSAVAARAASAALDDSEYVRTAAMRNANDRQEFLNQVNARMLRAIESHTNFVLVNPLRPVDHVVEHLGKHNIFVAPSVPQMSKYLRISLGTPAEMLEFWRVWDLMPPQPMAM